ncbi:MAG: hypothetical protein IH849_01305 [Acidobacteria bacterium]|nr:hypothetical protein [Acidobacteriota bacterium]
MSQVDLRCEANGLGIGAEHESLYEGRGSRRDVVGEPQAIAEVAAERLDYPVYLHVHLVSVLSPRVVSYHIFATRELLSQPSLKDGERMLVAAASSFWQLEPKLGDGRVAPVTALLRQRNIQLEAFNVVHRIPVEHSPSCRPSIRYSGVRQKTKNHSVYARQDRAKPEDLIVRVGDNKT